jgi:hypothetical protein
MVCVPAHIAAGERANHRSGRRTLMRLAATITALLAAIGTAGFANTALAERSIDIEINTAPPEMRYEAVPPPREGYIYERGHYDWDGDHYVWREGRFIEKREGHEWHPSVVERRGEHWHYRAGHWDDD